MLTQGQTMLNIPEPYSPFEELQLPLAKEKGVELFIKREDLSHEHISGNKWRKLKYHLLEAEKQQKKLLVTYGGAYSNHLLATAAAGKKYGFSTFAFVRGERVKNYILEACSSFGMELHFVSRSDYLNKELLFQTYFGSNLQAYCVPEGGGGEIGEQGVSELISQNETWNIWQETGREPIQIFTSVGTGATMRGLLKGVKETGLSAKVNGVVVLKGAEAMREIFLEFEQHTYCLHHQYHFGGYAKKNNELANYQKKFASQTGILLDHAYEAKMLWAIEDLLAQNYFKKGTKVVAIHNGGTWNLAQVLFG